MRTYKSQDGHQVCEQFADLYEFLDTIEERPVNKTFAQYSTDINNLTSHDHDADWSGSESWAAACQLMERGYEEGVNMILNAGVTPQGGTLQRYETAVVGFAPCIPNAIMGLPDSMITQREQKQVQHEVTVYYSLGANYRTGAETIAAASRRLLDAVVSLESNGTKVRLVLLVASFSKTGKDLRIVTMTLKEARQALNLRKLSYPLVHPSFFRRHFLAWMETAPGMPASYRKGYGHISSSNAPVRNFLVGQRIMQKTDYFISTSDLMGMTDGDEVMTYFNRQSQPKQ